MGPRHPGPAVGAWLRIPGEERLVAVLRLDVLGHQAHGAPCCGAARVGPRDAAVMRRPKRETHTRRLFDDSRLAIAASNDDLMHITGWKTYDMFSVYT